MLLRTSLQSLLVVLAATVALGLVYPLALTGVAQVLPKADAAVGVAPRHPVARYFQPRPSATRYSTTATAFANRGPNQAAAVFFYRREVARYLRREAPYVPGLRARDIPPDAVEASASGVDPHISVANARLQARRVAAVRRLPPAQVQRLVDDHTDGRVIGIYGAPGVDVASLNDALDR